VALDDTLSIILGNILGFLESTLKAKVDVLVEDDCELLLMFNLDVDEFDLLFSVLAERVSSEIKLIISLDVFVFRTI
jgi:hypothetical protein